MMKKILLAIFVALPMLAVAQAPKFGIVNSQTIIEAMPEFKTAQEQITTSSKRYEDEFQKLTEEAEKKYSEFQALAADGMTFIFENVIPVYTGTDVTDVTPLVKTRLNLK